MAKYLKPKVPTARAHKPYKSIDPSDTPADKRKRILSAIHLHWQEKGYGPSWRWLSQQTNVPNLGRYLKILRDDGLIIYDDKIPRSIRLAKAQE